MSSSIHQLMDLIHESEGSEHTDAQLLRQFASTRDPHAFELLLKRHTGLVWGVCRRIVRHDQDSEDAFQATFQTLAQKADSIKVASCLSSWLYRVAYRIAVRVRSKAVKHQQIETSIEEEPLDSRTTQALAETIWRDVRVLIDDELQQLPEKYRLPVILCYLEGQTYQEAARQLGWTSGTFSTRLKKARELLRSRLTQRGLTLTTAGLLSALATQAQAKSMPVPCVERTLESCIASWNHALSTGMLSQQSLELTKGVLRTMFIMKIIRGTAILLALGILGIGASFFVAHHGPAIAQNKTTEQEEQPKESTSKKDEKEQRKNEAQQRHEKLMKFREHFEEVAKKWTRELVKYQLKIAELEERLNQVIQEDELERSIYLLKREQYERKIIEVQQQIIQLAGKPQEQAPFERSIRVLQKELEQLKAEYADMMEKRRRIRLDYKREIISIQGEAELKKQLRDLEKDLLHGEMHRIADGRK